MAKILYPEGTAVQIRDWKLRELRAEGHTYDRRKRVVKQYHRGDEYPYELEGISERFAVDEIKRYRQDDDVATKSTATEQAYSHSTYGHKTYSREEVDKIVRNTVAEHTNAIMQELDCRVKTLHDHLVEDARLVALEAIRQDQNSGA